MSWSIYISIGLMVYLICILILTDKESFKVSINDVDIEYKDNNIFYQFASIFIGLLWLPLCIIFLIVLALGRIVKWGNND